MVLIFSRIFMAIGVYLSLSIVLAMAGLSTEGPAAILSGIGSLVYSSFNITSLYSGLFFIALGQFFKKKNASSDFVLLSLGIIPAILFGLALRIMFTNYSETSALSSMVSQFGIQASLLILGGGGLLITVLLVVSAFARKPAKLNEPSQEVEVPTSREEVNAVHVFRAGVAGLLESKLQTKQEYPQFDDGRTYSQTKREVVVNDDADEGDEVDEEETATDKRQDPPKEDLTVYFSSEGDISDYPPKTRSRWTTVIDDEVSDAEHEVIEVQRQIDEVEEFVPAPEPELELEPKLADEPVQEAEPEPQHFSDPILESQPKQADTSWTSLYREAESELDESSDFEDGQMDEAEIHTEDLPPLTPERPQTSGYGIPTQGILEAPDTREYWVIDEATKRSGHVLKMTLEEFGIQAEVTGIRKGPVITMFEILPAPGVKLNRITNLADNIALRLAAQSVRIVAPIPGKHAVGIEIPNRDRAKVSFSELVSAPQFTDPKVEIPFALGKDITGEPQIIDLSRTPHLLIAGSTGSGKSVCVNALICSILYRLSPAEVNLILIDPKIVELKFYNDIPHLLTPVITDPKKAFQALQWALYEMERRYSLLDAMQVRDIKSYNKKIKARNVATPHMPYLVIIIDEFADLMATSGKELEGTLARLAAMSRAVGIHLVLATQRPSTDVITGLIKANIPSRIAFMVASKVDSRIILDAMGADKLLGRGDMLFTSAWDPFPLRLQGAFLSEDEVEQVVTEVKKFGKPDYIDDEIFFDEEVDSDSGTDGDFDGSDDPLLRSAIDIVTSAKKASASYLQRRLKVGYNRAARMVEQMEEMGIVGPSQGSKPREILRNF